MCGRYTMFTKGEALEGRFGAALPEEPVRPTYNAAPGQHQLFIRAGSTPQMVYGVWGFLPEWAQGKHGMKSVINARAETVATSPYFKEAFRGSRCLVLADGFYEWWRTKDGKVPYRIALKTEEPFAFAGIWSSLAGVDGKSQTTFAIITTEPNELVAEIHNRMPVILRPEDEENWLGKELAPDRAREMLVPYPAELLTAHPVSPKVNSPANNTPEVMQPV